jgi:hypothetical protein
MKSEQRQWNPESYHEWIHSMKSKPDQMKFPRRPLNDPPLRVPECFLGAAAAARVLGISVRRLYRMVADRRILPDGFVEGEMRFRNSHLEAFIQSGLPGKFGRHSRPSMPESLTLQSRYGRS